MNANQLNQHITIQLPSTKQDEFGQLIECWEDVHTNIRAGIGDMSGREYLAAAAVQNAVITKIVIRYRPGITPAMRVLHNATIYNITAVLQGRKGWLNLMCIKGTASNG